MPKSSISSLAESTIFSLNFSEGNIWRAVTLSFYGLLYKVIYAEQFPRWVNLTVLTFVQLVNRFQLLILLIGFEFLKTSVVQSGWEIYVLTLRPFVSFSEHTVIFWIAVSKHLIWLLLFGLLASYQGRIMQSDILMDVFRMWILLLKDILYVPMMFVYLPILSCSDDGRTLNMFPGEDRPCVTTTIQGAVAVSFCMLQASAGILLSFFISDFRRESASLFAQEWPRCEGVIAIMKTVLVFKVIFLYNVSPWREIFQIAAAVLIFCVTLYYLPYHSRLVNYVQIAICGLYLSASFSFFTASLLAPYISNSTNWTGFLILALPTSALCCFLCWLRLRRILHRLHNDVDDQGPFARVADSHIASWILRSNVYLEEDEDPIDGALRLAVKQYPDDQTVISSAAAYAYYKGNMPMTIHYIKRASNEWLLSDVQFAIYSVDRMRKEDQIMHGEDNVDIQNLLLKALSNETRTRLRIRRFWSLLMEDNVDLAALPEAVEAVERTRSRAQMIYDSLLKTVPNSHKVLRQYASFVQEFEYDYDGATRILQRAEMLEDAHTSRIGMASHQHSQRRSVAHPGLTPVVRKRSSLLSELIANASPASSPGHAALPFRFQSFMNLVARKSIAEVDRAANAQPSLNSLTVPNERAGWSRSAKTQGSAPSPVPEDTSVHQDGDDGSRDEQQIKSEGCLAADISYQELALRRFYKERMSSGKTTAQRRLTLAIILTLALLLLNSTVFYGMSRHTAQQFSQMLERNVFLPARVTSLVARITLVARSLHLNARLNQDYPLPATALRSWLQLYVDDLSSTLQTLYFSNTGELAGPVKDVWESSSVVLYDPSAPHGVSVQPSSLIDALSSFLRDAAAVVYIPDAKLADPAMELEPLHMVLNNGIWVLIPRLRELTIAYRDQLAADVYLFQTFIYSLFFPSYAVLALVTIAIFVPTTRQVIKDRNNAIRLFLDIPKSTLRTIIDRIAGRIDFSATAPEQEEQGDTHTEGDRDIAESSKGSANRPLKRMIQRMWIAILLVLGVATAMFLVCVFMVNTGHSHNQLGYTVFTLPYNLYHLAHCAQERLANATLTSGAATAAESQLQNCFTDTAASLESALDAFRFGSDKVPALATGSAATSIMYTDAKCSLIQTCSTSSVKFNLTDLYTCHSLDSILVDASARITHLMRTQHDVLTVWMDDYMHTVYDIFHSCSPLQVLLAELLTTVTRNSDQAVDRYTFYLSSLFGVTVPLIFFNYFLVLRPAVAGLKREHERTMSMLLMIPLEVIERVSAIQSFLSTGQAPDMKTMLQETKEQTKSILQAAVDAVIVADAGGAIQMFNPAATKMLGYSRDEVATMTIQQILPGLAELFGKRSGGSMDWSPLTHSRSGVSKLSSALPTPAAEPGPRSRRGQSPSASNLSRSRTFRGKRQRRPAYQEGGEVSELTAVKKDGTSFPATVSVGRGCANGKSFFVAFIRDVTEERLQERLLAEEKQRSDGLLLNILPAPIAERLKAGEKIIANLIDEATILFSDIVSFTSMSAAMSPEEVVLMLSDVFVRFDNLNESFHLEKVKTIGDCYMCYTTHPAVVMVDFAFAMIAAVEDVNRDRHTSLQVRIGINTGTVIGGVLGTSRLAYDIWGDSVNMAARMEQTGLPSRIQVSHSTYDRIKYKYDFEQRNDVYVKGKGVMDTYLVIGKRSRPNILEKMQSVVGHTATLPHSHTFAAPRTSETSLSNNAAPEPHSESMRRTPLPSIIPPSPTSH